MLVQKTLNEEQNGDPFKNGDTVKVMSVGKTGKIVGFENGMWLVKLNEGDVVSADSEQLEHRQVLLG
jgi:dsDNA-specific endonuclease/ATPase MutS2